MCTWPSSGPPFTSTGCCFVAAQTVPVPPPDPFWCSAVQMKHPVMLYARALLLAGVWVWGRRAARALLFSRCLTRLRNAARLDRQARCLRIPEGLVLKCVGGVEWELHTQKMIQGHALERWGGGVITSEEITWVGLTLGRRLCMDYQWRGETSRNVPGWVS